MTVLILVWIHKLVSCPVPHLLFSANHINDEAAEGSRGPDAADANDSDLSAIMEDLESSSVAGTGNASDDPEVKPEYKSLGYISLDYRLISTGHIILMVGNYPLLRINLYWILSNLSRTSRKNLAKWLNSKDIDQSPWPLHSSTVNSIGHEPLKSGSSSVSNENLPGESISLDGVSTTSGKTGIEISKAFHSFIAKLLKCCGLSKTSHSNSIFDSLRIWITKNQPVLFYRNKDDNDKYTRVVLDNLITKSIYDIKSKRKSASKKKSSDRSSTSKTGSDK
jgi:hypothetical protein